MGFTLNASGSKTERFVMSNARRGFVFVAGNLKIWFYVSGIRSRGNSVISMNWEGKTESKQEKETRSHSQFSNNITKTKKKYILSKFQSSSLILNYIFSKPLIPKSGHF